MDSSVSSTHGEQEISVWNGHYACVCYHPLFVFNQFGDLERCALRAGHVHSADGRDDSRIVLQALGVVHILVSGKATKYRLPEQPGQCAPIILATACVGLNTPVQHVR
jgi:hypothetical protein